MCSKLRLVKTDALTSAPAKGHKDPIKDSKDHLGLLLSSWLLDLLFRILL